MYIDALFGVARLRVNTRLGRTQAMAKQHHLLNHNQVSASIAEKLSEYKSGGPTGFLGRKKSDFDLDDHTGRLGDYPRAQSSLQSRSLGGSDLQSATKSHVSAGDRRIRALKEATKEPSESTPKTRAQTRKKGDPSFTAQGYDRR